MVNGKYTEKEFEYVLELNINRLIKDKIVESKPKAYLLGGQPGAGKTTLHTVIKMIENDNVIVIDNDTFKQQHPNFDALVEVYGKAVVEQVTPFSNQMTEALIEQLSNQGYNLIIEGTGRTTEVPIHTAEMLQSKGYETNLYTMAVPKIQSYLGTIERYESMYLTDSLTARATPKQAHDIVVENLPINLEVLHKTGLFSEIRLYNREGESLYSSLETHSISPKNILHDELNRHVSSQSLLQTLEKIEKRMIHNQHQETSEFEFVSQHLDELKKEIKKDKPTFSIKSLQEQKKKKTTKHKLTKTNDLNHKR